jgi:F-type H+-transporting ATPase subunit b
MEELVEGLGLDWKILIAQIVNFGILLLILWKFAYKPLVKKLHERTDTIDKSLKDAQRIEEELKATEIKRDEAMTRARRDSQELLDKAKAEGEQIKQEMTAKAKTEVEKIVGDAHADIAQAKEKMIAEAKEEIGNLVISSTEQILGDKIDAAKDKELIDKALKSIK